MPSARPLGDINGASDTRDVLAHATRQAAAGHDDYFVVDIDAHVSEDHFWSEVIDLIDNDVLRQIGQAQNKGFAGANALLNISPGLSLQSVGGRIGHQGRREPIEAGDAHRFIATARRGMDALGVDYQVVFPTRDAAARHASAGRYRGRARRRLQSLDDRAHPAAGLRGSRGCSICRSTRRRLASSWSSATAASDRHDRLHGLLDAQQAGAPQQPTCGSMR